MGWFPATRDSNNGWRFDIVGLLAVIGESTIANHAQAITASSLSRFPRLIPAPQTLLKTKRPTRLPSTKDVIVMGVYSGTHLEELNYFADVIHDIGQLKDYEFRVYDIEYSKRVRKRERLTARLRKLFLGSKTEAHHKEGRGAQRRKPNAVAGAPNNDSDNATPHDEEQGTDPAPAEATGTDGGEVVKIPMHKFCALNILTIGSILLTIGLFIWAMLIHDGVACVALASISLSASIACLASQWRPELSQRPTKAAVPRGDVVIKTRGAAFVVVHCEEEITRELYAGTEKCNYQVGEQWYKVLVAISTVLLMVAVVLLGNCEWTMQAAIGAAYIILNGLYWGVLLVAKPTTYWDMRRYNVRIRHETRGGLRGAHVVNEHSRASFTRTLWYAIQETREVGWVVEGDLAPRSLTWKKWLAMAKENCDDADWDAVGAKDKLMQGAASDHDASQPGVSPSPAPQADGSSSCVV
ncbi:MAG: hypothetical protein M1839_009345 [Geoglossum umbratile]|nr:MAG: hypothetical protein M1839_009345 [Geoglossum umbratile]